MNNYPLKAKIRLIFQIDCFGDKFARLTKKRFSNNKSV